MMAAAFPVAFHCNILVYGCII